jgi:cobalt-zinc-cadmium efflux system outer membrane protein
MRLQIRASGCAALVICWPLAGQALAWTEARVIERFLDQSPYAREARARVEAARAEAAGRTLLPNPSVVASREGAGYAAFFQIEQQLPISGRRGLLKQAGAAAVAATESETNTALWSLRMEVRGAFYRAVAAQTREAALADGMRELEEVIRILRAREREGEGSRYDRLRAERELAEYRSQLALARGDATQARAALTGFLPDGVHIPLVTGRLDTLATVPSSDQLHQLALTRRSDYIAEQRQVERYGLEGRADSRLRYPEPIAVAGVKRGDVMEGRTATSPAIGFSIPLPIFNKGQTETARWRAEQERASARREGLARRIRGEIASAVAALEARKAAIEQYRSEVNQAGLDLSKIARVSYEEGEIGILELLDSYRVNRQATLRLVDLQVLAKEAQIELDRAVGEEVVQ